MTTSFRSTTPPPGAHRLSLKDMDLVPSPRSSTTTSRGKITESHAMSADGKRGCGAGVERKRRTVTEGSGGGGGGVARRGSLTLMANQLRRLEAGENSTKYHRSKQTLRIVLNSRISLGLIAFGATLALLLAILRTAAWHDWSRSNRLRVTQWILAAAFVVELALRLHASGPSYCSNWVNLCDTYAIVGGACLTYLTRWGSAVFFLRTVRVAVARYGCCEEGRRDAPGYSDKNLEAPAVQLYQLVMRTVRESCSTFTATEKKELRSLLSLLAHQQIYVDATLQRGNEDYWKEYGHGDKPRARPSIVIDGADNPAGLGHDLPSTRSGQSPTAKHMLGLAMQFGAAGTAPGSTRDSAVERVLAKVDEWDFDPFELDTVTQGHPLVTLSGFLFTAKYDFFSCFALSKTHFTNFMVEVEMGYGSGIGEGATNFYHNRRHAADVTQAVHYFLWVCSLGEHLQDVETVALILGSLIHDFKHPGRSNAFLTKTNSTLALTYNDISVLENFHLSEAFKLLRKDSCNFFRDVAPSTVQEIRQIMVSMVLATDLKMHFDVLGEFNSNLADVHDGALVDDGTTKTYSSAMKVCIKSADISHAARATALHLRWTRNVIDEFFLQGDEEKSLGLEPSPLCDRDNTGIASSQKNFIGFLVKPLFKSWVSFLDCPAAELCTKTLEGNEAMWIAKEKIGDDTIGVLAEPPIPISIVTPSSPPTQHSVTRKPSRIRAALGGGGNAVTSATGGSGGSWGGEYNSRRGGGEEGRGGGSPRAALGVPAAAAAALPSNAHPCAREGGGVRTNGRRVRSEGGEGWVRKGAGIGNGDAITGDGCGDVEAGPKASHVRGSDGEGGGGGGGGNGGGDGGGGSGGSASVCPEKRRSSFLPQFFPPEEPEGPDPNRIISEPGS